MKDNNFVRYTVSHRQTPTSNYVDIRHSYFEEIAVEYFRKFVWNREFKGVARVSGRIVDTNRSEVILQTYGNPREDFIAALDELEMI